MDVQFCHGKQRLRPLLTLFILFSVVMLLVVSAFADMYVGRYDGNVAWSFDSTTGELRMYGNCGMQTPPWAGLSDQIRSVYIAPGVTHLPRDAFRGCGSIREILLPDTVTTIGAYAFADCRSLSTLVLPEELIYIGEYALTGCTALSYVTYRGSSEDWDALCMQMSLVAGNEWLIAQPPVYTRRTYLVTVSYVSAETGEMIAPSVERTLTVGAGCTIVSPTVEQHIPGESAVVIKDISANQTVTVVYYRTHCEVQVHYVDEQGNTILPSQQLTVAHGASLVLQAPEIEGYTLPKQAEVLLSAVTQNGTEHIFRYARRTLSVTVRCLDEFGALLCEPIVVDGIPYRGDYDIPLPNIDGYTIGVDRVSGSGLIGNAEQTVTYSPVYHPVTLRYVDEQGNTLASPDVLTVRHGQGLTHTVKALSGYIAQQETVSIAAVTAERRVDVIYELARYLLTVRHQTPDGLLLTQTSEYVSYLQQYQCTPLPFTGYTLTEGQTEHLSGTMPAAPLTVTVYYKEDIPITDDGTQSLTPVPDELPSDEPTDDGALVLSGRTVLYVTGCIGGIALLALGIVLVRSIRKKRVTSK